MLMLICGTATCDVAQRKKPPLTFDEVDLHQRPPLTLKVDSEMLHFLIAMLDFVQVRRVGALRHPVVHTKQLQTHFLLSAGRRGGDVEVGNSLLQQRFGGLSEEETTQSDFTPCRLVAVCANKQLINT